MNDIKTTSDIYAPILNDTCCYVDTNNITFPIKCPCTNKEFTSRNTFNIHRRKTKKHKDWLAELNANKTNFYKDTIQLNQLVKQQQEMITSRDNIIETQKLHILHLEKQITKNVPTANLLDID